MPATDLISLAIAGTAAGVAILAAWFHRPVVPVLDGERWFKVALATLMRGQFDAAGESASAWEAAVLRFVPYHPAGRFPERKISNPCAHPTERPMDGEEALLEALNRTTDVQERWSLLYDSDERAIEARLADPIELGPAYAPSGPAGAGATWDDLAHWAHSPGFGERLCKRLAATWILLDGAHPKIMDDLEAICTPCVRVPHTADIVATIGSTADSGGRVVIVAEGDRIGPALQLLVDQPGFRDQVVAVVSVNGAIGGCTGDDPATQEDVRQDWLGAWFGQEHLDTEMVRLTPYMALQWLDRNAWPPGTAAQPMHLARFPPPAQQNALVETIESVDLGPLPVDPDLPMGLVAKALVFTVCGWIASRR